MATPIAGPPKRSYADLRGPAVLWCFLAGATLLWLRLDRQPPNWDDAWYLTNSLVMYDALVEGGVAGYAGRFLTILGVKAPLLTVLPTPFYILLGRRWHAAYLVNAVAMLLLLGAVYSIGRRYRSPRAGLVAAYITGTMPLLYGLSRWFLVEYALTALVAATIWFLLDWLEHERTGTALLLGVACGLGLLMKVSFPLFVLGPFLYVLTRSQRRWRLLAASAIPCTALALPWYLFNYEAAVRTAFTSAYGDAAALYGTGDVFSVSAIAQYLQRVVSQGLSTYYILLVVSLAAFLAIRRKQSSPGFTMALLWGAPFVVFVFGSNKDVRLLAPILPAFALALGLLLDLALPARPTGNILTGLLLAFPLVSMLAISFGVPFRLPAAGYARPYSTREWPLQELLNVICSSTDFRVGERKQVLLGTDSGRFNADNFTLTAVRGRLPLNIATIAYEQDAGAVQSAMDRTAFFVYKEGGEPGSAFFNRHFGEALKYLKTSGHFSEIPYARTLPDGGVAHVFVKAGVTSPAGTAADPRRP
jgi:4-amino-4-deoxy-L-arabinose transferase-like glycosyltransferase